MGPRHKAGDDDGAIKNIPRTLRDRPLACGVDIGAAIHDRTCVAGLKAAPDLLHYALSAHGHHQRLRRGVALLSALAGGRQRRRHRGPRRVEPSAANMARDLGAAGGCNAFRAWLVSDFGGDERRADGRHGLRADHARQSRHLPIPLFRILLHGHHHHHRRFEPHGARHIRRRERPRGWMEPGRQSRRHGIGRRFGPVARAARTALDVRHGAGRFLHRHVAGTSLPE